MRKVVLLLALIGLSFSVDWKRVETQSGGQEGKRMSDVLREEYGGGERNKATKIKTKLLDPAVQSPGEGKPYVLPGGQLYYGDPLMCGAGNTRVKKPFASVSLSQNTLTFRYASDPHSGALDRSFSYTGNFLCPHGFCNDFDRITGTYRNCQKLELSGERFTTVPVATLDACVNPELQPQPPTFYGGRFIELLLSYYRAIGKEITQSDIVVQGTSATYYGGSLQCAGQAKNPPQTQYYKNPYVMNDHALYYYHTCDPTTDASCRAVKGFLSNVESSGAVCTVERRIGDNVRSDRICPPGAKLYPDGYNEVRSICFSGDNSFMDFSSSFWLECNPDGRGFTLKGWGYWEGAPCGQVGSFPPQVQVQAAMPFGQNTGWIEVGKLSVNRRQGGEGLSETPCVSDITPFKVYVRNTVSGANNTLEVRVDNAPACNSFRFSNVSSISSEAITDNCSTYESRGCVLVNEWWEDAYGRRIQVIKNRNPVQQLTGCEEVLRDERQKLWTSQHQTAQAPPNNCNFPPKTCKVINGQTECRQWWKKIREYDCSRKQGSTATVDVSHYGTSFLSVNYDPQTGRLNYTERGDCSPPGFCSQIVRQESTYVCSVNRRQYTSPSLCQANCYYYGACQQQVEGYRCAKTGATFSTQEQCRQNCWEHAQCNTVYLCPTNGQRHQDRSACLSACNNCQEVGTCRENLVQGECNQEYFCLQGTLSGSNCVINPNIVCPAGYTWNASLQRCVANPVCPSGSVWNANRKRCESQVQCPSGFTWNANRGRCEAGVQCPSGGSWNANAHRCEAQGTPTCQVRSIRCYFIDIYYSYYTRIDYPISPSDCRNSNGRVECGGEWVYYGPYYYMCFYDSGSPGGRSRFGGGIYDWGWSLFRASESSYCASVNYSEYLWFVHTSDYISIHLTVETTTSLICPSGYTQNGSICVSTPVCPAGSSYDGSSGVCFTQPTCPIGWNLDSANGVCFVSPMCPSGGSFNPATGTCGLSASFTCPTGWTLQGGACVQPAQVRYRCSMTGDVYSTLSSCQSACNRREYFCSFGGVYSTLEACQSGCKRDIPDCCNAMGLCSGDNQLYPVDVCPTRCFRQSQCSPIYSYLCSLSGQRYSDQATCETSCREEKECIYELVEREAYMCSKSFLEYETLDGCLRACAGGGQSCAEFTRTHYVGTWSEDQCEAKYCLVKMVGENSRSQYELLQCQGDTCPAGDHQVLEPCKCVSQLKHGFGLTSSVLNVINEALRDRSCEK